MAAAVEMRGEGQSHQKGTQVHEGREKKVIKWCVPTRKVCPHRHLTGEGCVHTITCIICQESGCVSEKSLRMTCMDKMEGEGECTYRDECACVRPYM